MYTSDFLCRLFNQESQGLFDAREVVLGQTQQGGAPSRSTGSSAPGWPRTRSTGSATRSRAPAPAAAIGLSEGKVRVAPLRDAEELADWEHRRPQAQWWMRLRPLIDVLADRLALR